MLSGWNTYILVFAQDGILQFFCWNPYSLFLVLPSVLLLPQVVPACCPVVVVLLIAFSAISAYFLAVVWVKVDQVPEFPSWIILLIVTAMVMVSSGLLVYLKKLKIKE